MAYSITCSTKILFLAIAPILFILVCVLCEFMMVLDVYILLSPKEDEVLLSSWEHRCTLSAAAHSSQRFKPLSAVILLLCQGYCWIGHGINTNKEFNCFMVFIIRPSSTLKFQFIFGFN